MLWTHRDIDAAPEAAWDVLTDLGRWAEWGPSVAGAELDPPGRFEAGATGRVRTALGPSLAFTLTEVAAGRRWSWSVLGVAATSHSVEALDGGRVRVGFGVPAWAPPYLLVCALALRKIDALLTAT